MTDEEFIRFLWSLLEVALQAGDAYYPSKDEFLILFQELDKREIAHTVS